jgi:hypothetical protein
MFFAYFRQKLEQLTGDLYSAKTLANCLAYYQGKPPNEDGPALGAESRKTLDESSHFKIEAKGLSKDVGKCISSSFSSFQL